MPPPELARWDLFCRVIDNFGDVGVCWRLARDLASRGYAVRLVIDDASALAWMAPHGAAGVQVLPWPGPGDSADVVIEAFGCDPPPAYVQAMRAGQPVWINLEYLSAEAYVERSHGLPSPRADGLRKWFFYPGFTMRTGGLLREPGLIEQRAAFDRAPWLASRGLVPQAGERIVSLFCYDNPRLPLLLQDLSSSPTLLLLAHGSAPQAAGQGRMRVVRLPYLSQTDFDHLLWSCDLSFVRGEDSLVRAVWAGAPFVWQAYPQHDDAHHAKLQAMLAMAQAPPAMAAAWAAWNGVAGARWADLDPAAWRHAISAWRGRLLGHEDLTRQLVGFASRHARAKP